MIKGQVLFTKRSRSTIELWTMVWTDFQLPATLIDQIDISCGVPKMCMKNDSSRLPKKYTVPIWPNLFVVLPAQNPATQIPAANHP